MRTIIDNEDQKFYINIKQINAILCSKKEGYYLVSVYMNSGQTIQLKFDNEYEVKKVIERLKGEDDYYDKPYREIRDWYYH